MLRITLCNSGGPLASWTAKDEEDSVQVIGTNISELYDGDVIKVEEIEDA